MLGARGLLACSLALDVNLASSETPKDDYESCNLEPSPEDNAQNATCLTHAGAHTRARVRVASPRLACPSCAHLIEPVKLTRHPALSEQSRAGTTYTHTHTQTHTHTHTHTNTHTHTHTQSRASTTSCPTAPQKPSPRCQRQPQRAVCVRGGRRGKEGVGGLVASQRSVCVSPALRESVCARACACGRCYRQRSVGGCVCCQR